MTLAALRPSIKQSFDLFGTTGRLCCCSFSGRCEHNQLLPERQSLSSPPVPSLGCSDTALLHVVHNGIVQIPTRGRLRQLFFQTLAQRSIQSTMAVSFPVAYIRSMQQWNNCSQIKTVRLAQIYRLSTGVNKAYATKALTAICSNYSRLTVNMKM